MRQIVGVTVVSMIAVIGDYVAIAQGKPMVTVYKDATCGCCSKWIEHLRASGFETRTANVAEMDAVKTKHNVPRQVRSCHTALVGRYVIEGHVPAADVLRLLKQRPSDVAGLAVPGMPTGSPGMEVGGVKPQPFVVLVFDKAGKTRVFASH